MIGCLKHARRRVEVCGSRFEDRVRAAIDYSIPSSRVQPICDRRLLNHQPGLGEGVEGILDVALHDRFDVAVGDDRAAAFVLPPDGRDLVRERNGNGGESLRQEVTQPELPPGSQPSGTRVESPGLRGPRR